MRKKNRKHLEYLQIVYTFVEYQIFKKMKTLSLKLDDTIFNETEIVVHRLKKPRNRYINEALLFYNRLQKKRMLSKKLEFESKLVQKESMKILAEFENLEEYDN